MTALTVDTGSDLDRLEPIDDAARAALFTDAHTAHTFADTPVSDHELAEIWDLAKWAPTAINTQPLRVLYVRPGTGRERLVTHLNEGNRAKTLAAPAVAVLAMDTDFHEHLPHVVPFRPELADTFAADEDRRLNHARFNATLQAGYFILAVRAAGLAAGPMGGFDAAGLDAEFFPDGRWRSILVVNVGHPGPGAYRDRQPRLDLGTAVRWV